MRNELKGRNAVLFSISIFFFAMKKEFLGHRDEIEGTTANDREIKYNQRKE